MTTLSLTHRTILVVEDQAVLRLHAVATVKHEGLPVLQATNAMDALELLRTNPSVAVLFTDIEMPGEMDGLQLADRVHAERPDVQLVLTSGRIEPSNDQIADDGVFLAKPYSPEELTAVLREMLARNDERTDLANQVANS